jgi:ABC-type phosphate transport system permease subunit
MTLSPLESVRTMTATIAAEMGEVPFGSAIMRTVLYRSGTFAITFG